MKADLKCSISFVAKEFYRDFSHSRYMKYSAISLLNKAVKRVYAITTSYHFKHMFNKLSLSLSYKNT